MCLNLLLKIGLFILMGILFISCEKPFENSLSNKLIFLKGSNNKPGEEIWIMDENGKNQTRLVRKREGFFIVDPIWSPDGQKIGFIRGNYYKTKSNRIWVMDYDSGDELMLRDVSYLNCGWSLSWSPDSQKIAFSAKDKKDSNYDIYMIDADGTNKVKIVSTHKVDGDPYWSPNGEEIAFISTPDYGTKILDVKYITTTGNSDIYILNIKTKNLIKLTDNPTNDGNISWSPDGRKIAYISWRDNYEIFVIDIDTKIQNQLTNNSVDDWNPIWSPDGKKIAYVSDGMLYLIDPDGKNQIKLTDKTQCYIQGYGAPKWLNWSPDSKKIVFEAIPPHFSEDKTYCEDIYLIDIASKELKNLTNTPDYYEVSPSWRPVVK